MNKESFKIEGLCGQRKLSGEIKVRGMKNAVLPLLSASVLFKGPILLSNVPDIEDVRRMAEIIAALGGSVKDSGEGFVEARGDNVSGTGLDQEIAKRMRASMIITGPLLARFGKVSFPHPGGCVLGDRPIDMLLLGFQSMGAKLFESPARYEVNAAGKLRAMDFFFRIPSVTTTESLMMAAVLAEGATTLRNAAMEPEVVSLAEFLIAGGGKISGAGTPTIKIEGGNLLTPPKDPWPVIPDRIEAGSFLILSALAGRDVLIADSEPEHLRALIETLRKAGASMEIDHSSIFVKNSSETAANSFKTINIKTHEYPGFPTDLQAPMAVFLTQAAGESLIHETIFDGRLNYTADLVRMGADIQMWDAHRALVKGPTPLKGRELDGPDIRAGLAYIIAAIIAEGESVINNAYFIDRGYEKIEERLAALGVKIERIGENGLSQN